jgi:hypothetical protein
MTPSSEAVTRGRLSAVRLKTTDSPRTTWTWQRQNREWGHRRSRTFSILLRRGAGWDRALRRRPRPVSGPSSLHWNGAPKDRKCKTGTRWELARRRRTRVLLLFPLFSLCRFPRPAI